MVRELGEAPEDVVAKACAIAGVSVADVIEWRVARSSIDARGRRAPRFVLTIELDLPVGALSGDGDNPRVARAHPFAPSGVEPVVSEVRPVVLGMGPCGLFAALRLSAAGLRPIVLDRGKPVETRAKDVSRLMGRGEIDVESNLCFGEGGALYWCYC